MPYPDWTALAPLVLAMSLAYLRLEIFSQRRQIEDHARRELEGLAQDDSQLPEDIRGMPVYKELRFFAGREEPERDSKIQHLIRYQRMWDRKFCAGVACFSGVLVVWIPFVRIEKADEWLGISAFLTITMAVSLVGEIFLVLYSSQVIREASDRITYNADNLTKAIQASIPESTGIDAG